MATASRSQLSLTAQSWNYSLTASSVIYLVVIKWQKQNLLPRTPPHLPSPSHTHNPLCGSINTHDTIFHQFLTQPIVFGVAFPFPCLRSILKTAPSSPLQFAIIYSQRFLFSCSFTAGEQRCPPGQTPQQKSVTLLSHG